MLAQWTRVTEHPRWHSARSLFLMMAAAGFIGVVGGRFGSNTIFLIGALALFAGLSLVALIFYDLRIGILLLAFAAPMDKIGVYLSSILPITFTLKLSTLFIMATFAAWATRSLTQRGFRSLSPGLHLAFLGLIASYFLSLPNSIHPRDSLETTFFRIMLLAICYMLVSTITSETFLKRVLKVALLSGGLVALYGLIQALGVYLGFDTTLPIISQLPQRPGFRMDVQRLENVTRITSFHLNPNPLAGYLQVILVLVFALLIFYAASRDKRKLLALLLLLMIVAGAFALAASRSGFLSLAVAGLTVAVIKRKYLLQKRLLLGLCVAAILLGILVFATPLGQKGVSYVLSLDETSRKSTQSHLQFGVAAIDMFLQHPIVGGGVDTYRERFLRFYNPYVSGANAHSFYLNNLVEVGLVGSAMHLALAFLVARWAIKTLRTLDHSSFGHFALTGLLAGYIGILVGNTIYGYYELEFVWFHIALLMAASSVLGKSFIYYLPSRRTLGTTRTSAVRPASPDPARLEAGAE